MVADWNSHVTLEARKLRTNPEGPDGSSKELSIFLKRVDHLVTFEQKELAEMHTRDAFPVHLASSHLSAVVAAIHAPVLPHMPDQAPVMHPPSALATALRQPAIAPGATGTEQRLKGQGTAGSGKGGGGVSKSCTHCRNVGIQNKRHQNCPNKPK